MSCPSSSSSDSSDSENGARARCNGLLPEENGDWEYYDEMDATDEEEMTYTGGEASS